jgi:hypothetical protein
VGKAKHNEMYTTNLASKSLPATYIRRREECEKLLEIARNIESVATSSNNTAFQADQAFEKLEYEYKEKLLFVSSLSL